MQMECSPLPFFFFERGSAHTREGRETQRVSSRIPAEGRALTRGRISGPIPESRVGGLTVWTPQAPCHLFSQKFHTMVKCCVLFWWPTTNFQICRYIFLKELSIIYKHHISFSTNKVRGYFLNMVFSTCRHNISKPGYLTRIQDSHVCYGSYSNVTSCANNVLHHNFFLAQAQFRITLLGTFIRLW